MAWSRTRSSPCRKAPDRRLLPERARIGPPTTDALIAEAAQRPMTSTLLSEGLPHGRHFGDVIVENPFHDL